MYLCIDRGNSRTKSGIFNSAGQLVHAEPIMENVVARLETLIPQYEIQHAIVSTTGESDWDIRELKLTGVSVELSHTTPLPITILYRTPETLGRDRIASACGAHAMMPGKNCLVIDAGTCVTMDMVLAKGFFIGGNIGPGLEMRLRAMHEGTARLPLAEPGFPELTFGDSTLHALQNGACLGMVMEIEGIINRAQKAYGDISVVITGGDAARLAGHMESQIFVEPELVVHGLFQILSLNVENTH
jgi:type III pantothenate kinase